MQANNATYATKLSKINRNLVKFFDNPNMYETWSLLSLYHHALHGDIPNTTIESTIDEQQLLSSELSSDSACSITVRGTHNSLKKAAGESSCFNPISFYPDHPVDYCIVYGAGKVIYSKTDDKSICSGSTFEANTQRHFTNKGSVVAQALGVDENIPKCNMFCRSHKLLLSNAWSGSYPLDKEPYFEFTGCLEIIPSQEMAGASFSRYYTQTLVLDEGRREMVQRDPFHDKYPCHKLAKYHLNEQRIIDRITFDFEKTNTVLDFYLPRRCNRLSTNSYS